jgi:hypothetical protein
MGPESGCKGHDSGVHAHSWDLGIAPPTAATVRRCFCVLLDQWAKP